MSVITRIESIGGGWVGSRRRAKANIQTEMAVLCHQWVTQTGTTQTVAVRISLAPHAVLLMPLRGHTGHEMHPYGFTALQKSRL